VSLGMKKARRNPALGKKETDNVQYPPRGDRMGRAQARS
jgi:hypothetical protein